MTRAANKAPLARVPGAVTDTVTLTLPPDVNQLSLLQREAEADAAAIVKVTVTDAETLAFADALLTDVVRRKDAAVAMRKRVTGPAYAIVKEVEAWFRPLVKALEGAETRLKGALGAYRLEQRRAEDAARELAAAAAATGDADALLGALAIATEAAAPDGARATTRYAWAVKRIVEELLPDEWWCPDAARIEAIAKDAPGDGDAPVIPGVVFERVAIVGARR